MAAFSLTQNLTTKQYDDISKACWIAHVKEMCGLNPPISAHRHDPIKREKPCPPDKVEPIKAAFRHFGMME